MKVTCNLADSLRGCFLHWFFETQEQETVDVCDHLNFDRLNLSATTREQNQSVMLALFVVVINTSKDDIPQSKEVYLPFKVRANLGRFSENED
jgi:hypothetical protein